VGLRHCTEHVRHSTVAHCRRCTHTGALLDTDDRRCEGGGARARRKVEAENLAAFVYVEDMLLAATAAKLFRVQPQPRLV